jgi:Plasmid pRiA4b ORF-3-like protein
MPTKKIESSEEIYQVKVTLLGTRPPIWRRLLVPAELTLAQLHDVLQAAMGWENCHLHEFRIGRHRFGVPDPNDRLMGGAGCVNERKARLFEVFGKVGAKGEYTYDFGDTWEHAVTVEKILMPDAGLIYPLCTDGKLHGPPEDCGGIGGFYHLLEAIRDPDHDEHEELLEWIGSFDPEAFSVAAINQQLRRKFRPARKTAAKRVPPKPKHARSGAE